MFASGVIVVVVVVAVVVVLPRNAESTEQTISGQTPYSVFTTVFTTVNL